MKEHKATDWNIVDNPMAEYDMADFPWMEYDEDIGGGSLNGTD